MQLREFAEQVLFGTTMEDKLSFPREEIVDTNPGDPIKTPRHLPRPSHLALRSDGVRARPPREAKLADERERGRLLHFFGNHELLATELMALVLLKFPDAPASFRHGVLETLKEEQIHTRLYMHRMKQCGIEFGELPLSDYFWKSVSSMEDPLDYVTRLSLTFEQANLDYSLEYKSIFESVGDESTASLLERIYRDEIEHVGFGLKWFRWWKASGKTDWEAYRERLVFPLSPARAKGNQFNKSGRVRAGLDDAFIGDLQIFQQSRGRTPSIHWFNPDSEQHAAANAFAGGPQSASPLQRDLAILPLFYARKDDILAMANAPSPDHLRSLLDAGFPLPEILTEAEPKTAPPVSRKIGNLRPWSWTPDSRYYFRNTVQSLTRPLLWDRVWNEGIRDLFSKVWSSEWGKGLALASEPSDWLAPSAIYGQPVQNVEALSTLRQDWRECGYEHIVCKAPFGTAAQQNRLLRADEDIAGSVLKWLDETWESQGAVVVEPWLDRVFDFSLQCEMRAKSLQILAFTPLINNYRGQFKGILTGGLIKGLNNNDETVRFLMQPFQGKPRVYQWYEEELAPRLAQSLQRADYRGPLGIDAFVYRDPSGALRLKPVVETNPRFTMGRVAYSLGKRNASRSLGYFQILNRSQLAKTGYSCFKSYSEWLSPNHPVRLTRETAPRIISGSLPLNDPQTAERFLAVYHVRESISEIPL